MPTPSPIRMEVPTDVRPLGTSHDAAAASRRQLALALHARDGRLVAAAYAALAGDAADDAAGSETDDPYDAAGTDGRLAERRAPDRAQLSLFGAPSPR